MVSPSVGTTVVHNANTIGAGRRGQYIYFFHAEVDSIVRPKETHTHEVVIYFNTINSSFYPTQRKMFVSIKVTAPFVLASLSLLGSVSFTSAALKNVNPGDDVNSVLQNVTEGDVLKFSAGTYSFHSDRDVKSTCPKINCVIQGAGIGNTVFIDFYLKDCNEPGSSDVTALVVQDLTIIGTGNSGEEIMSENSDGGAVFRNVVFSSTSKRLKYGVKAQNYRYGFVNCQFLGFGKADGSVGIYSSDSYALYVINSKIANFDIGFQQYQTFDSDNNVAIAKSDLLSNNRSCSQPTTTGAYVFNKNTVAGTSCSATSAVVPPNTIKSPSMQTVMLSEITYLDTQQYWIRFPASGVTTEGHTTIYRVPGEYLAPPAGKVGSNSKQRIMYFQFDTTAVLSAKPTILFNRANIDPFFPGKNPSFYYYSNNKWNLISSVKTDTLYSLLWPSTLLGLTAPGLIGIFA